MASARAAEPGRGGEGGGCPPLLAAGVRRRGSDRRDGGAPCSARGREFRGAGVNELRRHLAHQVQPLRGADGNSLAEPLPAGAQTRRACSCGAGRAIAGYGWRAGRSPGAGSRHREPAPRGRRPAARRCSRPGHRLASTVGQIRGGPGGHCAGGGRGAQWASSSKLRRSRRAEDRLSFGHRDRQRLRYHGAGAPHGVAGHGRA